MAHTTLVSADETAAHLDDPQWIICDCRHELADNECRLQGLSQRHTSPARASCISTVDLSGPKTGLNGRHPLPHPATFCLRLGALGIDQRQAGRRLRRDRRHLRRAAVVDAALGRAHDRVAVLDGGWQAWTKAGLPVTAEQPAVKPAPSAAAPNCMRRRQRSGCWRSCRIAAITGARCAQRRPLPRRK